MSKAQRTMRKLVNWKTGAALLAVLLVAFLLVGFLVGWDNIFGGMFGTAGPAGGQTCLPSCETNDGRFLGLPGEDMASFGGAKTVVWITVPADWGSFELGWFDGDSGKDNAGNIVGWRGDSNWDNTTTQATYTLYADPMKQNVQTNGMRVQSWSSMDMPNNQWFNATINTEARAKLNESNVYVYRLDCERPVQGTGVNAFKLRSNAWLSAGLSEAAGAPFGFTAMRANDNDTAILFPEFLQRGKNYFNPGPTTYDGTWNWYFYLPTDTVKLEIWDGDFDRGTSVNTAVDTDDPNSEGIPVWAPAGAVAEGIGGSYLGRPGMGAPNDDYSQRPVFLRTPPVWYQITDPRGQPIYLNGEPGNPNQPSGTEEWERYVVTTRPDLYPVPSVADSTTSELVAGLYTWHIEGLDVHNFVWIRTEHELCPDNECPDTCKGSCPRTIGYWKNNFDKILAGKDKGIQETRESLENGLLILAQYSELYRHGIDYCNPVPISDPTPMTMEEAWVILMRDKKNYSGCDNNTMLARALQQNLATWMNMSTGKICPGTIIEINVPSGLYEGTVWQALTYDQDIILYQRGDAFLLERAKDIADMINNVEINVDPSDLACDAYTQIIPPAKQPKSPKDLPKGPKPPAPPPPVIGCDNPRVNTYGVENPTNNPFFGIKFQYQSGTEVRDGGYDEFRFILPAAAVEGMTSVQLEAKAGEIVGQVTLVGCVFNQPNPCEEIVENNGFVFSFQGAIDNGDGTLTLIFHVQNNNGFGLSHATFGVPEAPSSPSGNYQSQVCP